MKHARTLAAILAALLLMPSLASCANDDESADTRETQNNNHETQNDELKDSLPEDLNYGGDKIVFISDFPNEIFSEKLTSDPVNDIVFERNKAVEQRLNVNITCFSDNTANIIDKVVTSINGGSADYDVVDAKCWTAAPKTIDGFFSDLKNTAYLDFDKIWWNKSFNDAISYHDAQYAVTGAMVLSLYRRTYTTVFNKAMFTDAGQKYLYEYVDNGTWTLDKQASLVPLFYKDNGDQVQDLTNDIFGFVSNDFISVDPYWAACGVDIIKKNADGDYEWVFDTNRMHDMADKVLNLFYATDGGAYIETDNTISEDVVLSAFSGSRAAMATMVIQGLESSEMRQMTDEYGVVPIPKYDETQTTYRSQMHDGFSIVCIPTTVQGEKLDKVSAVLEAMAATSYKLVRPVYYETTLRTKIAQDPQSSAMMDLIINNIYIDPGFVFSAAIGTMDGSFHQSFQDLIASKTNDTASRFKTAAKSAKNGMNKIVLKLNNLTEKD